MNVTNPLADFLAFLYENRLTALLLVGHLVSAPQRAYRDWVDQPEPEDGKPRRRYVYYLFGRLIPIFEQH